MICKEILHKDVENLFFLLNLAEDMVSVGVSEIINPKNCKRTWMTNKRIKNMIDVGII